jgi:1-aminocyclopropane-1-carboxylate deaminase/D-cysteine desulfhydrase-like pyridoxal-dependent ACC family enzyme
MHKALVRKVPVIFKRDDCFRLFDHGPVGNKARKLKGLYKKLAANQNTVNGSKKKLAVISYGGAQSNSCLALAQLCHYFAVKFLYVTKKLPPLLANEPKGILFTCLNLGMEHIECSSEVYRHLESLPKQLQVSPKLFAWLELQRFFSDYHSENNIDLIFVPQGGAMKEAADGIFDMVDEVASYLGNDKTFSEHGGERIKLVMASGTGTGAYFAAKRVHQLALSERIEVIAAPCGTNDAQLRLEMLRLEGEEGDATTQFLPTIINDCKHYTFGKPRKKLFDIWQELKESTEHVMDPQITFDLLYAPRAFELMFDTFACFNNINGRGSEGIQGESGRANIIYYLDGGIEGNITQLMRYEEGEVNRLEKL